MSNEHPPEPGVGWTVGPPTPSSRAHTAITPFAWLVPIAFVVSLVSLFFPWFEPGASGKGRRIDLATLHAWEDGVIFVVPPVGLLLAGGVTVALLLDRPFGRFRGLADPVRPAGWFAVVIGVLSAICVGIEWLLVPAQFPNWSIANATFRLAGLTLGRNPKFGYLLNAAAAVLAIAGGALMVILSRGDTDEG